MRAEAESSKSLFRATVPVEELKRHIGELMREARKDLERSRTMYGDGEWVATRANGKITALEDLLNWLFAQPGEQAPARNDKLTDGSAITKDV